MSYITKDYFDEQISKITDKLVEIQRDLNAYAKVLVRHDVQLTRHEKDIKTLKAKA